MSEEKKQEQKPVLKRKRRSPLRNLVLTLIIIIALFLLAFELFGEKGIKFAIETAGTKVLKVDVSLDNVSLSPIAGKLELEDFSIANPAGFNTPKFFEMGQAEIKLDTPSLLKDTIEIEHILLDEVHVTIEQKGLTSNLKTILDTLPQKGEPTDEETPSDKSKKKLHISTLEITNISVSAKILPVPGQIDVITLNLPDIKKTDIGGDKEPITTEKLIVMIVDLISKSVAENGAGKLPETLLSPVKDILDQLNIENISEISSEVINNALNTTTETIEGAANEAIKKTQDVGNDLLKGLFNNKEDE